MASIEHTVGDGTDIGSAVTEDAVAGASHAMGGGGDGQGTTSGPNSSNTDDYDPDEIALRARAWYIEAINHPLWKDYKRDSKEDMGFYVGGKGQWSKDGSLTDYDNLVSNKRVVVSINHCASIVDILTGYERQNRSDLKAAPQGEEDDDSARLLSWFLKFEQDQCQCQERVSEMFEDGVICGMDAAEVGISYTEDPSTGRITMMRLRPGLDIIWDPHWTEYDGSDARFFIKPRWAFLLDLDAEFPEHRAELRQGITQLNQFMQFAGPGHSGPRPDAYGSVRNHPVDDIETVRSFYNEDDQQLLVLEVWYRIYETEWVLIDRTTSEARTMDSALEARTAAAADPDNLKAVPRKVRKVRMSTIIPATFQVLESDVNPYPNDDEAYPFALYIAKRKLDTVYGMIRNLKDPQRIENKRWSQTLEILGRFAQLRPMVAKGALANPETLSNPDDTSPIVWDAEKAPQNPPSWFTPPLAELARVLTEVALQMKVNMREVSGVNTDLLGIRADDASGIAIARRQAQGQVIATLYFDNLRRTRKYIGQRLAKRIQQVYTREKVVRLTNDYGQPVVVRINPAEWKVQLGENPPADKGKMRVQWREFASRLRDEQKPEVLRNLDSLEFDVVITDAPSSPTARAQVRQELLDLVKSLPEVYGPVLLEPILEMSDFPGRAAIIGKIRAISASGQLGAGPNGGGAGANTPEVPTSVAPTPPTAPPAA